MAFYALAKLADLHDQYKQVFRINGLNLLLIQDEGERYIIEDLCPHMDAKLSTGRVVAGEITCRAHGIVFSLNTGKPQGPLAGTLSCLKSYSVAYDNNMVGVEL